MPEEIRKVLERADDFEYRIFDSSYLQFLDEQIDLNARGAEWTKLMTARRRNLSEYAGIELLNASSETTSGHYSAKIDPRSGVVVHWERLAKATIEYLE